MDVLLETERMTLRRFTLNDVGDVLSLDSDPQVRRFVEDGVPVTVDQAARTIEHWLGCHERSAESTVMTGPGWSSSPAPSEKRSQSSIAWCTACR